MAFADNDAVEGRLAEFLNIRLGRHLGRREQKESFALYAHGILADGERKSVEPIAARATGASEDDESAGVLCERMQARLLNFLRDSPWDDRNVRREAARYVIEALEKQEPVTTWIIDDTGFPKQGKHSVGVQRQYTGTLGKVGNCQIGVSLTVATKHEHVPIDFALYMPKSWTNDATRREKARVPDDLVFKTKPDLALDLITRAVEDKIPGDIVLVDAAYGASSEFRNAVRMFGLDLGVAITASTKVWQLDTVERRRGDPVSAQDLGALLGRRVFRRLTWRVGPGGKLSSRFSFRRVKVAHDDGTDAGDREPLWLVMEWPEGETRPTKFILTTLPRRMSKKQIVRVIKERWRTERAYEELKGELGLDHFEGRSFPGWHHHVSVVLSCYAFIVSERVRRFSPTARRQADTHANSRAA
ncbi:MAG TPA: IS701 family transposase [Gemmatimonadaceae bacterium]|nr:IS701 family transposase [Gemmatimonadaceae bacterium]